MRIASHATLRGVFPGRLRTLRYSDDVSELWGVIGEIIPFEDFEEESLARAKASFWNNHDKLSDEISYKRVKVRDEYGNTSTFASGSTLSGAATQAKAIDTVYDKSATSDAMSLAFLLPDGTATPSNELYVLIGGASNEFAIPSLCSKDSYEYVLGRLLHHNR
jgi:hypothetical protein